MLSRAKENPISCWYTLLYRSSKLRYAIQCTYTSVLNIGFSSQHTVYTCSCYEYTRNCTVCISTALFISIDMHSVSDLGFQTNRAHVHVDIRHNSCSRVRAGSGQVQLLHVDLHRSAYRSHVHVYSFWPLASKIVSSKSTVISYDLHSLSNSLQLSLHLPASTLH